jgi:phosphate transport system ATP-binding protein
MTKQNAIIDIKNLSLSYDQTLILKSINLPIVKGSVTTLIGPSGSGKSSFLMCLNRLNERFSKRKQSGTILFNQKNVDHIDTIELRRNVGMIFQKPSPFPLSIRRNLELPLIEHGMTDKVEIEKAIKTALSDVGLWNDVADRLQQSALKLSGGQQQRLCIARAIILNPQVLLMDEPCSSLDPISTNLIESLVTRLKEKYTIFMVTHNLAQAKRVGDYTALFWVNGAGGYLESYLPTNEFFESPQSDLACDYICGKQG